MYSQAFYFASRLLYVSVFIDIVSISVYYTSLFVGDVNSLLMVSTKTTKIEPPRNIMILQYYTISQLKYTIEGASKTVVPETRSIFCFYCRWQSLNMLKRPCTDLEGGGKPGSSPPPLAFGFVRGGVLRGCLICWRRGPKIVFILLL